LNILLLQVEQVAVLMVAAAAVLVVVELQQV
jgi:hypothetical protein